MRPANSRISRAFLRNVAAALWAMLAALTMLSAGPAHADEPWVLVAKARSPSEVSLWTRFVSGQQMKQFRGETYTTASGSQALAAILETTTLSQWLWRCEQARIVRQISEDEYVLYLKFNAFWPLDDRDAVLRVMIQRGAQEGLTTLTGTALPEEIPAVDGVVRVPTIAASFSISPEKQGTRIGMTGHFDPGGVIPVWAANLVVTVFPKYSLSRFRSQLEESR